MINDASVTDALRDTKVRADQQAAEEAAACRMWLARSPTTVMMAGSVTPNYRFFRRLAGLRNGDLNKQALPK